MTIEKLILILESQKFISTFKDKSERPIFSFKDGFIGRDGIEFGKYKISKNGNNFRISIYDTELGLFTEIHRNIIIYVKGDNRFPISLTFNSGSDDIILEGEKV